ncbi:hypothetical protein HOLleu_36996 [Holothuria leucospilota]|uniref:Uncharacterized protein n=1 Tax=Holothuria leucospilota TaxID=206669 RepID=A0A9Q0YMR8_HOLLE|nr:hypothetical protein HOLleu_36996 [Holothuria leucospilota]
MEVLAGGKSAKTMTSTVEELRESLSLSAVWSLRKYRSEGFSSNTNIVPRKRNSTVDSTKVDMSKDTASSTQKNEQSCKDLRCSFHTAKAGNRFDYSRTIFSSVERVSEICHEIQMALTSQFELSYVDEKRPVDEFNKSFIKDHFPNISKETYMYPLVIQPLHPHESTSDMKEKNRDRKQKSRKFNTRKGYEGEQKTALALLRMFEHFKIPVFMIRSYLWNKTLCKGLVEVLEKNLPNETPDDGEQDILVFLPKVGVLLIEVKSRSEKNFDDALRKSRTQLKALLKYVSYSTLDLIVDRNVPFVKVVSFPYYSRKFIRTAVCDTCFRHFIAEDDLTSPETLHSWYEELIHPLQRDPSNFDQELVGALVARLIGPLTNVVVKGMSEVIADTCTNVEKYGSPQQIKNLFQLNEEQKRICFKDPRYLWITGDPGTGKTVLALWKVQQILTKKQKHIIYLIAGNRDMMLIKLIETLFNSNRTGERNDVQLRIESIETVCPRIQQWYDWEGLLYVIKTLTQQNIDSYVSIIVDEFRLVSNDASGLPEKIVTGKENLKFGNLKNLWIIQKPFCKTTPDFSILELGFELVNLQKIMRMSAPNIKLINRLLNNAIIGGHACDGPSPELYKMECICKKLQATDEPTCIPFLIRRLTEEVVNKLKDSQKKTLNEDEVKKLEERTFGILPKEKLYSSVPEDVVVMTKMNVKVKKLLSQKQLGVVVRPAVYFTGCEKKVVIVDIRNEGSFLPNDNLAEALTRAKGKLVLIDVCCENAREENRYLPREEIEDARLKELLDKLYDPSETDIRRYEKVEFDEKEMDFLREDISLGLYRDEQEIHENMGSVVTVGLLQKTLQQQISPIRTHLAKLDNSVSSIPQMKDDIVQIKDDIVQMKENLNDLSSMFKTFMNEWKSSGIVNK